MKVRRVPVYLSFRPFIIEIHVEQDRDSQLLLSLIRRMQAEVKQADLYYPILEQLRLAVEGLPTDADGEAR